jgi:hypothetical protein
MRLDSALTARIIRLAAFAAHCGPLTHEAMAAHCEIAADFAGRLGFGPHVQQAVHYQWERNDGRVMRRRAAGRGGCRRRWPARPPGRPRRSP